MAHLLRMATIADSHAIWEIYSDYIKNTPITFETVVPSAEEFTERIGTILDKYPFLVFEKEGNIVGYSNANLHRVRAAYKWSVDVMIYLKFSARSKGIGKILYKALLEILKAQGYFNIYAGITLPNPASIGLHESFGFKKVAEYNNVGFKLNEWHSVGWWELHLNDKPKHPKPPISVKRLCQDRINEILSDYKYGRELGV